MNTILKDLSDILIGKTVEEAKTLCSYNIRPIKIDGKPMIGTRDYRTDRIQVIVENTLITEVVRIG